MGDEFNIQLNIVTSGLGKNANNSSVCLINFYSLVLPYFRNTISFFYNFYF